MTFGQTNTVSQLTNCLILHCTHCCLQGNAPKYIVGGRAIVFPCIQTIQRLPLNTMTLEVVTKRVYTAQGVPISVSIMIMISKMRLR